MSKLILTVKGQLGTISLDSFLIVVDSSISILKDLDSAISKEPKGSLDWVIDNIYPTNSIGIELKSKPRKPKVDYSLKVAEAYTDGIEIIQKQGITPPYFSDNSLKLVNKAAHALGKNGANSFEIIDIDRDKHIIVNKDMVNITKQLAGYSYKSFGSVEGTLEMVSIHKPARFNVYHSISLRAVRCNLKQEDIDKIRDALGRTVVISGLVSYNSKDEPISVFVQEIDVIPKEEDLPSIDEFIGSDPNFTEDVSTEDYIRGMRSA